MTRSRVAKYTAITFYPSFIIYLVFCFCFAYCTDQYNLSLHSIQINLHSCCCCCCRFYAPGDFMFRSNVFHCHGYFLFCFLIWFVWSTVNFLKCLLYCLVKESTKNKTRIPKYFGKETLIFWPFKNQRYYQPSWIPIWIFFGRTIFYQVGRMANKFIQIFTKNVEKCRESTGFSIKTLIKFTIRKLFSTLLLNVIRFSIFHILSLNFN